LYRPLLPLAALLASASVAQTAPEDPHIWLEEIQGERALAQVEEWNEATERDLSHMPGFEQVRGRALAILNDDNQIAAPMRVQGDTVLNLWRDANNPRGLWRVSPIEAYLAGAPEWRVLIDVDALGREEGVSWVWGGANCLAPDYRRCLVSLSPGGTDAVTVREFDMEAGAFVEGGFTLPEAKTNLTWIDRDSLLVVTDYGPESLTTSGYGRIAKVWRRGTALAQARTVFEAERDDVSAQAFSAQDDETRWTFLRRGITFWTASLSLLRSDGRVVPTPLPESASYRDVLNGMLIASLNEPLEAAGTTYPSGAIVAWPLAEIAVGGSPAPELVMAPSASQAIEEVSASDDVLWVKALDDVSGKLFALRRGGSGQWAAQAMDLPDNSTLHLNATAGNRDLALVSVEGMLTPPTLITRRVFWRNRFRRATDMRTRSAGFRRKLSS
jgi:prolyl oligopeptidase